MDQELKQIVRSRMSVLPKNLREHISVYPWRQKLADMSTKYGLSEEQKMILKTEIFLVLAGIEPLYDFRFNMTKELGVSYEHALKISTDTNSMIFEPVLTELKQMGSEIS